MKTAQITLKEYHDLRTSILGRASINIPTRMLEGIMDDAEAVHDLLEENAKLKSVNRELSSRIAHLEKCLEAYKDGTK